MAKYNRRTYKKKAKNPYQRKKRLKRIDKRRTR